jgi:hypothetical protein
MTHITVPVVGMHFWPPAKVLVGIMPTGHALILRPEPTNPYDENAIAVWADASSVPLDLIKDNMSAFEGAGDAPDLGELESIEAWTHTMRQLGYVAKTETDKVRGLKPNLNNEWDATIAFDGSGKPTAKVADIVPLDVPALTTSEELDLVTRSHQDAIDRT